MVYRGPRILGCKQLKPVAEGESSPLRITGHSPGGSMAMLAAYELSKNYTVKDVLKKRDVHDVSWSWEHRRASLDSLQILQDSIGWMVPHLCACRRARVLLLQSWHSNLCHGVYWLFFVVYNLNAACKLHAGSLHFWAASLLACSHWE